MGKKRRKATTSAPYTAASVRVFDGMSLGGKPRPWNYEAGIRAFNAWAFAAAMMRATAFASVPLRLYVRRREGKKLYKTRPVPQRRLKYLGGEFAASIDERPSNVVCQKAAEFGWDIEEVVEPHPVLQVLSTINPYDNGYDYAVLRSLDRQITGNSYLHPVIDANLGVPFEAWRMPPQWVKVKPSRISYIEGYVYGAGTDLERTFRPEEVIHFKLPNPGDLWYGKGWYEAAWTSLGLHTSKRELDLAFTDNYQRPDSLLMLENATTKDSLERALSSVRQQVQGTDKAGKMVAIGGKGTLTPLNWQITETGTPDKIISEIAACSGVPEAMLRTNDPTKAGAESARLLWYRTAIRPECKSDEEKLNEKWVPLFAGSEDYFVSYDPVSFEDESELRKNAIGAVAGGILKVDEGRAEIGYGPVPGGDMRYPPSGITGGASAVAGNVAPGQNDARNNGEVVNRPTAGLPGGEGEQPTVAADSNGTPAEAVETNDLRATVGGSAQILAMQEAFYAGRIPREAAIQNAVLVFGFTAEEASTLFPEVEPENKPEEPEETEAAADAVSEETTNAEEQ